MNNVWWNQSPFMNAPFLQPKPPPSTVVPMDWQSEPSSTIVDPSPASFVPFERPRPAFCSNPFEVVRSGK